MTAPSRYADWFHEVWPVPIKATGVGYAAVAYIISRWLTRRSPIAITFPVLPGHLRLESLTTTSDDNIRLFGWCIEPGNPRATVVLHHGMRDCRLQMLDRVQWLAEMGFRCVLFDHRNHGESEGRLTSFGWHERKDAMAIARYVAERWPAQPRAALGCSMGAAALCYSGEASRLYRAIVLENLYRDLATAFDSRIGTGYPGWVKHFRHGVVWITEKRLGMRLTDASPIARIADLAPTPILLLTGSDDAHAPPAEVQSIAAQIPDSSQFAVIAGAKHSDVFARGGEAYRRLVLEFLERNLFKALCHAA